LTDHQINVLEWTILGLLHDHKKGLRYNDIATTLAVEPPFITKMISILMKKNLVIDSAHEKDKRAKKVSLTDEGRQLVDKIETILKKDMNTLLKDVHIADTLSYLDTMDRIVENGMTAIKAK
jgi:DNA-binding MarR family transcriptional regulator